MSKAPKKQPQQKQSAAVINEETKEKILRADLANVVKKVKSGKPLSSRERKLITEASEKPPEGLTVSGLARMLGNDRATVRRHTAKLTPCATRKGVKYYRLIDVEKALAAKPDKGLKEQKTLEEIRKLRIANDAEEGKLVARSLVAESLQRCLAPAAAALEQRLVNEYPTGVAGLDVPQARIYGRRLCDELLEFLQSLSEEWKAFSPGRLRTPGG